MGRNGQIDYTDGSSELVSPESPIKYKGPRESDKSITESHCIASFPRILFSSWSHSLFLATTGRFCHLKSHVSWYQGLTILSAVIGVALGAIPLLGFVHGNITGSLRKQAKVPYPHSYASMELCKENVRLIPGIQIGTFILLMAAT